MEQGAAAEVDSARERCQFSRNSATHRRGEFPALAVGASFGGGQQVSRRSLGSQIHSNIYAVGSWKYCEYRHQCRHPILTSQQYRIHPHCWICVR